MPRYKHRPDSQPNLPGLFDNIEINMADDELPTHPSIAEHVKRELSGGQAAETAKATGDSICEPLTRPDTSGQMKFISLGSGSSGNCAYIGDSRDGMLIDAGVDPTKVEPELLRNGIDMSTVSAILLTHDHGDHVRYAYQLLRRNKRMGLYCTPKALNGILRRHNISRRIKDYHHAIYKEFPFAIGRFTVTAFDVDHDGTDNAGFFISHGDSHRFVVATDLGHIGPRADFYMRQATCLMIESNYDLEMLSRGSYPEYLKARIMADNGHLDNRDAASFVASAVNRSLTHVFLCHLSHDNNTPEIAVSTMKAALEAKGLTVGDGTDSIESRQADIQVTALPRFEPTRLFIFR